MKHRTESVPEYCLHRATDQAFVTFRNGPARDQKYLGPWGSPVSLDRYRRVLRDRGYSELEATAAVNEARKKLEDNPPPQDFDRVAVLAMYTAYVRWAEGYYRLPTGAQSREVDNIRASFRDCIDAIGDREVRTLGRKDLVAVRERMIGRGLSRKVINQRVGRIVRAFVWGTEEERNLVPESVAASFHLIRPLVAFRTSAPERNPVRPAARTSIDAILSHASPVIGAMIRLQLLTGMRPGEVRGLRKGMIQKRDGQWVADFGLEHKMSYKKKLRVVILGPETLALLKPWMDVAHDPSTFLFSPKAASRNGPTRLRHLQYTRSSYAQAVRRLCRKAGVANFTPHQLRHTAATEIRAEFGIEAAQKVLGHGSLTTTERYAQPFSQLEIEVAKKR